LLGLAVTFGGLIGTAVQILVWCVLPTPFVVCAIFGRGNLQSFAIGVLVPWAPLMMMGFPWQNAYIWATFWLLIVGTLCGAIAVATRRWLERSGDKLW
jgi:hypothetical protein